jgi:arylsulfatase A-like enzyme
MKQLLTILLLSFCTVMAADKPSIIYILADDLGWADVGWHGSELLKMDSNGPNWT